MKAMAMVTVVVVNLHEIHIYDLYDKIVVFLIY